MSYEKIPDKLRDEALDLRGIAKRLGDRAENVDHLIRERDEARGERDEARAALAVAELREKLMEPERPATTLPRVVRPDELREGQTVAACINHRWAAYKVDDDDDDEGLCLEGVVDPLHVYSAHDASEVVLLADAPEPEPAPEWEPEHGDVGIVTSHVYGAPHHFPASAVFNGTWWRRLDGNAWPDGNSQARPDEVEVTPADIVAREVQE